MGADYSTAGRLKLLPARLLAGCYLDLGRGVRDTTLVVSTGRSGSTWVGELVNHRNEYRVVFEPFRGDRVRKARPFRRGHYIDPHQQEHPLASKIDALLAGRVRSWWTDEQNRRRLARRRIVKEIRLTNLLPWIRARHPDLRIVYAVRDPVVVAQSWLELGWGDDLDVLLAQDELMAEFAGLRASIDEIARGGDIVERHVLRWCLENAIPLTRELPDVHRIVYEDLRREPEREIERLFAYLGEDVSGALEAARRPSATAGFPRVRAFVPTDEQRTRAREIVELFGLSELAPVADSG
jgi:hypothetical protein